MILLILYFGSLERDVSESVSDNNFTESVLEIEVSEFDICFFGLSILGISAGINLAFPQEQKRNHWND